MYSNSVRSVLRPLCMVTSPERGGAAVSRHSARAGRIAFILHVTGAEAKTELPLWQTLQRNSKSSLCGNKLTGLESNRFPNVLLKLQMLPAPLTRAVAKHSPLNALVINLFYNLIWTYNDFKICFHKFLLLFFFVMFLVDISDRLYLEWASKQLFLHKIVLYCFY